MIERLACIARSAAPLCVPLLLAQSYVQGQSVALPAPTTRAEQEAFLLRANIVTESRTPRQQYTWRVTLDDGKQRHRASVETADGTPPSLRNYRFNVATYELDKLLDFNLVVPSVLRLVNGRPASVTWWVDDVAMAEQDRRAKRIEPPDRDRWEKQIQAVRAFDELIANLYRNERPEVPSPTADTGPQPNYEWGELLITPEWSIWLIDHTMTFRTRRQLERPDSLTRCDRGLLARLRALDAGALRKALAEYLSPEQLDALEVRRALLVKHFDDQIARRGERAVLYDSPWR